MDEDDIELEPCPFCGSTEVEIRYVSGIRPQLPATNTYEDAMVRLADLIDRPTCRNVYDEIYDEYEGGRCENGLKCSECGEIVEDYEGYRITGTFNYCPKCGREVVD